jgi:hypothetical protein
VDSPQESRQATDEDCDLDAADHVAARIGQDALETAAHNLRLRATRPKRLRHQLVVKVVGERELCLATHRPKWAEG